MSNEGRLPDNITPGTWLVDNSEIESIARFLGHWICKLTKLKTFPGLAGWQISLLGAGPASEVWRYCSWGMRQEKSMDLQSANSS